METIRITEKQLKLLIKEAINELELYHGTQADFNQFDIAYLSTGWGQQAYGRGFYLTDNHETAEQYARNGYVYTVEVPNGKYLENKPISYSEKRKITEQFYKFFLSEYEYGKEAYPDKQSQHDFWEYEVKSTLNSETGLDVYNNISTIMGDENEVQRFLTKLGYAGLKIFDDTYKLTDKGTTYVIFNQDNIKVLKKEKITQ